MLPARRVSVSLTKGRGAAMKPTERRETGQRDMFRSRLDQIIDMGHPLVRLAGKIDWAFLESLFGEVHEDKPGRPPLATRLMAGLAIIKHMPDLDRKSTSMNSSP